MRKGTHHTPEALAKMRATQRRLRCWLGRHHTEETRAKMSLNLRGNKRWLGKHHSPETRTKMSEAQRGNKHALGRHHSPEARAKMSVATKGRVSPMKGKHRPPATRARMSASQRGKHLSTNTRVKISESVKRLWDNPEYRQKVNAARRRGWKHTVEFRSMTSKLSKERWQDPAFKERTLRRMLKGVRSRPTNPERAVQVILDQHFPGEWKYVGDGEVIIGGKNPDFVNVNGRKACLDVFGDWWHGEQRTGIPNEQAVAERIAHFAGYGFRCVVLWEDETKSEDIVLRKLQEAIQ